MVKLESPRGAGLPVRFAKSPLWETVACARLVARGRHDAATAGLTARDIPTLAALLACDHPYVPDFLAPPPLEESPSFEDELAGMRRTVPSVVAEELGRMHPRGGRPRGLPPIASIPEHANAVLQKAAGEVEQVWERAMRDAWPRLDAILEADIELRARRLAASGPTRMFPDLSGLEFEGGTVTVRSVRPRRRVQVDRELLLVPSVLGSPDLFTVVDAPWPLSVYYPARAAAELREPQHTADDWLETLAGRTRARVLRSLRQPSTTTQIAVGLRIAPASASQHLQRLRRAGLIRRTRRGVQVVYTLSETGRRLLALEAAR